MTDDELAKMTYAEKEMRLNEILTRLDRSETPMDDLAGEAKEAAMMIASMQATLTATKAEIATVFEDLQPKT